MEDFISELGMCAFLVMLFTTIIGFLTYVAFSI